MPLLLNVLQNADGPGYRKLRVKAMECAGLIGTCLQCGKSPHISLMCHVLAIAVGRDVFRADANTLVELLIRIQSLCPLRRSFRLLN
jgi:hypothetical protein